jgi:tRNA(fMet)-specific endonuclease VapC
VKRCLPRGREREPIAISAITASELLHGVHRAGDPRRQARRAQFVEAILARLPVVEFGLEAARTHAQLWAEPVTRGRAVGAHDLLIGATAIAMDFQVATANARDFGRIPGLGPGLGRVASSAGNARRRDRSRLPAPPTVP